MLDTLTMVKEIGVSEQRHKEVLADGPEAGKVVASRTKSQK